MRISLKIAALALLVLSPAVYAAKDKPKSGPNQQMDANQFWWPERINLAPLRQHAPQSNPLDAKFDYATEFNKLDLKAVKKDIESVMKTSQDWWPADYGHYGPFFIRMA